MEIRFRSSLRVENLSGSLLPLVEKTIHIEARLCRTHYFLGTCAEQTERLEKTKYCNNIVQLFKLFYILGRSINYKGDQNIETSLFLSSKSSILQILYCVSDI